VVRVRNKYFLGAILLDQPRDRRVVTSSMHGSLPRRDLMEPCRCRGSRKPATSSTWADPLHAPGELRDRLERVQDLAPDHAPLLEAADEFFVALNKVVPNYGLEILILSIFTR